MIKEAFQFLTELGAKAQGFQKIDLPDGSIKVIDHNGTVTEHDAKIPDRKDTVTTLDSLIAWINHRNSENGQVEVFVNDELVVAVVSRKVGPTADRIRLPLRYSKAWLAMTEWLTNALPQKEVVKRLRGPLYGCCSDGMVGVFRALEFSSSDNSQRKIHGSSSDTMGRQAHREATSGGKELPEQLSFGLPVYDLDDVREVTVPVAIDVDYDAERIRLLEVRDSVSEAKLVALRSIAAEIEKVTERVYFGSYSQE